MITPRQAAAELQRRRRLAPMAYASLWDRPAPHTSQRRALALDTTPGTLCTLILGGNRTGKSESAAMYAVAQAAGRDAVVRRGRLEIRWVARWLARNGLPPSMIPLGPGRVWVGSPTFGSAVEQIRPKLRRWAPAGSRFSGWTSKTSEGTLTLPGGGVVVSKAYQQYDRNEHTWEGASLRAGVLDEQPNSYANFAALASRLVDQRGRIVFSVTPLRGKADWLYTDLYVKAPAWLRIAFLHGVDNPHVPEEWRQMMLAAMPEWQRESRDKGAFSSPEGAIWTFDPNQHDVDPFEIPEAWVRWVGIDWGARAPHVVWAAEDPADGTLYCYRELAPRRETTQPAISDRQLVKWAKEQEEGSPEGMNLSMTYRVADSEAPGAIEEAAFQGWWVASAVKGPGSVLAGITLLESLLTLIDPLTFEPVTPRIKFFRGKVPVLRAELEGLRWDDPRAGQPARPKPGDPDHGPDALRYLVRHRQAMGFR